MYKYGIIKYSKTVGTKPLKNKEGKEIFGQIFCRTNDTNYK